LLQSISAFGGLLGRVSTLDAGADMSTSPLKDKKPPKRLPRFEINVEPSTPLILWNNVADVRQHLVDCPCISVAPSMDLDFF